MKPSHSDKMFFSNLFSYPSRSSYMCIIYFGPFTLKLPCHSHRIPSLQKVSPAHTDFHVFFGLGLGRVCVWWGVRERGEQRTCLVGIAFRSMHMRFFTGLYGPNFLELTPLRKMSPCPPNSHHLPIERREGVGFRSLAQI